MKILLALLLFCAGTAHAATFYVDSSCANNGNGTTSSCAGSPGGAGAWNVLSSADTCPGTAAGDHIQLRNRGGTNPFMSTGSYAMWQNGSSAGCSGTALAPKVLENYPGEDAVIDGAIDIHGSTWTSIGSGVFNCTGGTCAPQQFYPFMLWWTPAAGGAEQDITLDMGTACDTSLAAGKLRFVASSVCVHLPDGSNPSAAQKLMMPGSVAGFQLAFPGGPSHFHIQVNQTGGGSFTVKRMIRWLLVTVQGNSDIAVIGTATTPIDFGWTMDRCLDFEFSAGQSARQIVVKYANVHHCGQEGMHSGQDNSGLYQVSYSHFHHNQVLPWFPSCGSGNNACLSGMQDGGCALRISDCTDCLIGPGNEFDHNGGVKVNNHTGSNINDEGGVIRLTIDGNYFHDSRNNLADTFGSAGILISSNGAPQCTNCIFRNNRFYNMDQGIEYEGNSQVDTTKIYNNTFYNIYQHAIGFSYGANGTGSTSDIRNNIFYNPVTPTDALLNTNGLDTATITNNAFFCTAGQCTGTIVKTSGGTNYTSSSIGTLGTGNQYGSPNISITGTLPSLRIKSPSGTAYQTGVVITPAFPDWEGDTRPGSGAWDIGADAYLVHRVPAPAGLHVP